MVRADRDEDYVIDVCDEILGEPALRQYRFGWLRGDPGRTGRRVALPVDAYWPDPAVVLEYRELQHEEPNRHFDKPDQLTISGVHRGILRAIYDARRDELIPAHGIRLVVITPHHLDATGRGRLRRTRSYDQPAIERLLLPDESGR